MEPWSHVAREFLEQAIADDRSLLRPREVKLLRLLMHLRVEPAASLAAIPRSTARDMLPRIEAKLLAYARLRGLVLDDKNPRD